MAARWFFNCQNSAASTVFVPYALLFNYKEKYLQWNYLEQKLVTIADKIAPIVEYTNNETTESSKTPVHIKRKINTRKRLLHRLRHSYEVELKISEFLQSEMKSNIFILTNSNNELE